MTRPHPQVDAPGAIVGPYAFPISKDKIPELLRGYFGRLKEHDREGDCAKWIDAADKLATGFKAILEKTDPQRCVTSVLC